MKGTVVKIYHISLCFINLNMKITFLILYIEYEEYELQLYLVHKVFNLFKLWIYRNKSMNGLLYITNKISEDLPISIYLKFIKSIICNI